MQVKQTYLKNENNEVISPVTSVNSVYGENGQNLLDLFYPVGSYYETSNSNFNPNKSWGGTWVQDTRGLVTVGIFDGPPSLDYDAIPISLGQITGESYHKLTEDELPAHNHGITTWKNSDNTTWGSGASSTVDGAFANVFSTGDGSSQTTGNNSHWYGINDTGMNESHNNIQPSIGVIRWHRTA